MDLYVGGSHISLLPSNNWLWYFQRYFPLNSCLYDLSKYYIDTKVGLDGETTYSEKICNGKQTDMIKW